MQVKLKITKDGQITYEVVGAAGAACLPIADAMARVAEAGTLGELCMKPEGEFDVDQTVQPGEQVQAGA